MKKSGLLKILGVGVPLFFATQFANGQTIVNRTNNHITDPFTKTITENKDNIYVEYTDSLFAENNGQRGELIEVDNRQITDNKGDNNLFGKKDKLAVQQTQPGLVDEDGNMVISDFVFQNYIFTNNKTNESLKQITEKEISKYDKYITAAQNDHRDNNMQQTFYNDLDRSADEAWSKVYQWVSVLEKEKELPREEKTITMMGPTGEGPEITRGIGEELYLQDKEGNKRKIIMTENSFQVVVEDVGKEPYVLMDYLLDGKDSYYKYDGELKTATQPGENNLEAMVYVSAGDHSEEVHRVLTQKYFNETILSRFNERVEALKIGKLYIDPNQDH